MSKLLVTLFVFFLVANCSLNKNSKFWSSTEEIQEVKKGEINKKKKK